MTSATRKRWFKILIRLLVWPLLICFVLRWFEHHQVYQPFATLEANADELGRPFEDVHFTASDGVKLHAWFFPANTNSRWAGLAMLICHGNAGNISHRLGLCEALLETGVNVFVFDYRGYGRSEGTPGEEGTYRDAQAAYQWLRKKGFAGANIVAFGESLGGGVISELALREKLGGLVLHSTYTSIPDIGADLFPWLPVRWINTIKYDTRSKLPSLKLPVMVMHSRADTLIPYRHAERNFAAANEPKTFWELKGDHNDYLEAGREHFLEGMEKFLSSLDRAAAHNSPSPGNGPRELKN
ncbi:MAG: alpha/beta hydrolase [Verrucomicrobia bacterium]|nr:alpha/beta hydrolase [Verrucomicrobiota bacterium]